MTMSNDEEEEEEEEEERVVETVARDVRGVAGAKACAAVHKARNRARALVIIIIVSLYIVILWILTCICYSVTHSLMFDHHLDAKEGKKRQSKSYQTHYRWNFRVLFLWTCPLAPDACALLSFSPLPPVVPDLGNIVHRVEDSTNSLLTI
jgi:hypothetical protein